jgi:hypothetical protein
MAKKTMLAKKKRGPAPTGKGVQVVVRLQPDDLSTLDDYIREQEDVLSRPEAVRRLLRIALRERWKWQG